MKLTRLDTYNCWCGLSKRTHHHHKRQDNPIDPSDTPSDGHQWVPLADDEDVRCIRCDVRYGTEEACV